MFLYSNKYIVIKKTQYINIYQNLLFGEIIVIYEGFSSAKILFF